MKVVKQSVHPKLRGSYATSCTVRRLPFPQTISTARAKTHMGTNMEVIRNLILTSVVQARFVVMGASVDSGPLGGTLTPPPKGEEHAKGIEYECIFVKAYRRYKVQM
jgi:hypothetical protein